MQTHVPQRTVRCYHCKGETILSRAARSATCPKCYKGLVLDDITVTQGAFSGRLSTCGRVIVEPKARAITRTIQAGDGIEVSGTLEGNVSCLGTVTVGSAGRLKGECEAESLVVHAGAIIQGTFRIQPQSF